MVYSESGHRGATRGVLMQRTGLARAETGGYDVPSRGSILVRGSGIFFRISFVGACFTGFSSLDDDEYPKSDEKGHKDVGYPVLCWIEHIAISFGGRWSDLSGYIALEQFSNKKGRHRYPDRGYRWRPDHRSNAFRVPKPEPFVIHTNLIHYSPSRTGCQKIPQRLSMAGAESRSPCRRGLWISIIGHGVKLERFRIWKGRLV